MNKAYRTRGQLLDELQDVTSRMMETEETLRAILGGEVDGLVVSTAQGDRVFTLSGADHPYRVMVETMNEGAVTLASDGTIIFCNQRFADIVKGSLEKVMGSSIFQYISSTDVQLFEGLIEQGLRGNSKAELALQAGGENYAPVLLSISALAHTDMPGALCIVVSDLTEQKRNEEILAEEKLTTQLLHQAAEIFVLCDHQGRIIRASQSTNKLFGRSPVFQVFDEAFHLLYPEGTPFNLLAAMTDKALHGLEVTFKHGDKESFSFLLSANSLITPKGVIGIVVVMVDITERKKTEEELRRHREELEELVKERTIELVEKNTLLQEEIIQRKKAEEEKKNLEDQLIQAQKMEALGRFAGGIAHDLNNILYPIIIDTESLLEDVEPGTYMHLMLNRVLNAAHRQKNLVKQILSFSRRSEQHFNGMKVVPLIKETIDLLRSSLPSHIKIMQSINATSDSIFGDPTQIQQIIMNLCRNAADAIGSRTGTIEVSLTNTYLAPSPVHPEIKAGQYIKLMVKDTGNGMKKEVMDRIFEPFFTTKDVDKGSGMGLAVVHGILKLHGGIITVDSEEGKGSQFSVYLPKSDEKIDTQTLPTDIAQPVKGKGKVLLVDDEAIILSSLQNVLKRMGYDVVAVKDGQEAYEVFRKAPSGFDLVITDMTMPQITGVELSSKLIDIRSDIPIILCTGFNDVIDEEKAKTMGISELLLKPASVSELKAAIGRALENP